MLLFSSNSHRIKRTNDFNISSSNEFDKIKLLLFCTWRKNVKDVSLFSNIYIDSKVMCNYIRFIIFKFVFLCEINGHQSWLPIFKENNKEDYYKWIQ